MLVKVLHFYRTYFPDTQGGLEEAIRQICTSTKHHGVENKILTLSRNPKPRVIRLPEADVYRAKLDLEIASCSMGTEAFSMFKDLEKWADIVHYHFPWPFADAVKLWNGSITPSLITYHSDIIRQRWLGLLYRPLMNRFLEGAAKIVATSPNYALTSSILRNYNDKLTVIPLGLDEKTYPSIEPALIDKITTEYGNNFFLFVGVLREYKGLKLLLNACKNTSFDVLIAGRGPQETALKDQAHNLDLTNVHFLGYVSDEVKIALMHCCRAVILPSHLRSEAFGVVLLEAAMLSKPAITFEIGTGTSFINRADRTGLVVPVSSRHLRSAMLKLSDNPRLAIEMGINARHRFDNKFSASMMGQSYFDLYNSILCRDIV